jgi:hypothetical protein
MALNPETVMLNPSALVAAGQRRTKFVPVAGTNDKPAYLVVHFPGESMRCVVKRVLDDDTALVQIISPPVSRVHTFRFEEIVGVRRRVRPVGEIWEAQYERDFFREADKKRAAAEAANPKPVAKPKVAAKPEAKPTAPPAVRQPAKKQAAPVQAKSPVQTKTAKAAPKKAAAKGKSR